MAKQKITFELKEKLSKPAQDEIFDLLQDEGADNVELDFDK